MMHRFDLTGEIAIVTGSEGKLGKVWTKALQDAGATVFPTDHPNLTGGFFGRSNVPPSLAGSCDLTKPDDVAKMLDLCTATYGTPTILINNAGVDDRPGGTESWQIGRAHV